MTKTIIKLLEPVMPVPQPPDQHDRAAEREGRAVRHLHQLLNPRLRHGELVLERQRARGAA